MKKIIFTILCLTSALAFAAPTSKVVLCGIEVDSDKIFVSEERLQSVNVKNYLEYVAEELTYCTRANNTAIVEVMKVQELDSQSAPKYSYVAKIYPK